MSTRLWMVTNLIAAIALALASPKAASANDLFDTTISFSFADDNLLRDAGETRRNSPNAYFGQAEASSLDRVEGTQFRSSSSLLQLSKSIDTGTKLTPSGALIVRLKSSASGDYTLSDYGSVIDLSYQFNKRSKLGISFLPIDSDRFRLGHNYDISWGGSNVFPKNFRKGLVPAAKIALDTETLDFFVGMKSALIRSPAETILNNPGGNTNQMVERAYYGFLSGLGLSLPGTGLRLDLQAGYFDKGTNTRANVLGQKIYSGGGTAILSWNAGGKVGHRLDTRLYSEDPLRFPLQEGKKAGDFGVEVAVEYTRLIQTLEDPDNTSSTKNEWGQAMAFTGGIRLGKFRTHLNVIMRDLPFIVFNVPGFVPYQALPENAEITNEVFGVLSFDYFFEGLGITPAISFGVLKPSTYKADVQGTDILGTYAEQVSQGIQKVVVGGSERGDWDILPAGSDEELVLVTKVNLKWSLADSFAVIGEVTYAYDSNTAQVTLNDQGHAIRNFDNPNILGLGFITELQF
jgi:hypothetical protein